MLSLDIIFTTPESDCSGIQIVWTAVYILHISYISLSFDV